MTIKTNKLFTLDGRKLIYFGAEGVFRPILAEDYFVIETQADGPVDARSIETGGSVLGGDIPLDRIRGGRFREVAVSEWVDLVDFQI